MSNYYSYESVDIEAAYREQEYMNKAEENRYLHNILRLNQEMRNKMQGQDSFVHQIYRNIRYLWLRHANIFSRMDENDSIPDYSESPKMR